jgi:DNA (cytosine-5)-methyltransferase 1
MIPALFVGPWRLADLPLLTAHGRTVFSCFACGGGSTMGYKLAGFDVLGALEIDAAMLRLYRANHAPRLAYNLPIQAFRELPDERLDPALFELDVLDGSPPCSVFSLAGARSRKWGTASRFREGQATQRLDDLFLHFVALASRLRPRVVVAENVKGLIQGKARGYVIEILKAFVDAGYRPQLYLLNAARMGVPQARERSFFIATRADLDLPPVQLAYSEPVSTVREAFAGLEERTYTPAGPVVSTILARVRPGRTLADAHPRGSMYTHRKLHPDRPAPTVTATCCLYRWDEPRRIHPDEAARLQTFPEDYDPQDSDLRYVCGMSVPPFMMQRLALELGRQLFGIEYDRTRRPLCPPATASSAMPTSSPAPSPRTRRTGAIIRSPSSKRSGPRSRRSDG